ncbi:unnamed protein product, partial [Closterium sp. NIES-54]
MASLHVLLFDHKGRPIKFDTWLDDLQLYLLSDSRDSVSLFDHTSGAAPAPPAIADSATRSQWLTCDAAARLAIRNHLPLAECAHLAIRNHLPLAECAHFGQHRTGQALHDDVLLVALRARPSLRGAPPPPLPPPTPLLLLLTSLVLRTSGLLLLVRSAAAARSRVAGVVVVAAGVVVGAAVEVVEAVEVVAVVGVVVGVGAFMEAVVAAVGVAEVAAVGVVAVGLELLSVEVLAEARGSSSSVQARPPRPNSFVSVFLSVGRLGHRCFSHLDHAWRAEFGDEAERTRWAELLRSGVAIFDLDYDAILAAMYALSVSAEGDFYLCVPPDPGVEAAALGASDCALPGNAPAEALHTFTLDAGASRCFFRDTTTLTPGAQFLPVPPLFSRGRRSGSTPLFVLPPVAPNSPVAPPPWSPLPATPSWHALPPLCHWSSQVSASPPALACPALSSLRRGGVARCSSLLVSPDNCSPADSPHGRPVFSFASSTAKTFLSCVCTLQGGEFSSNLLRDFCRGEGILQSFMLSDSPQQNGIAEHRIGLVMEVARTSMIHAAAPLFLWHFAVRYIAHQLNLWPRVSLLETSPTLRWTGEVGDASLFR